MSEDITRISEAWPTLPDHIKKTILGLLPKVKRKKATPKPKPEKPAGYYNPVPIWCEIYKSWKHVNPHIDGKDAKTLNELAKAFKQDVLTAMIKDYFEDKLPCPSVTRFYFLRNEYAAHATPEEKDPDELLAEMEGGNEESDDSFQCVGETMLIQWG